MGWGGITPSLSSSSVKELHNSLIESRTSLCFVAIFSTYFFPSSVPVVYKKGEGGLENKQNISISASNVNKVNF